MALKVFSIIAIVLGGLAILSAATAYTFEDGFYSVVGGGLFLTQGILSLQYMRDHK